MDAPDSVLFLVVVSLSRKVNQVPGAFVMSGQDQVRGVVVVMRVRWFFILVFCGGVPWIWMWFVGSFPSITGSGLDGGGFLCSLIRACFARSVC